MTGPSATLRRSVISIVAAVGVGRLLAAVRQPGRDDGVDVAVLGARAEPTEAYEGPEAFRRDPYERFGLPNRTSGVRSGW